MIKEYEYQADAKNFLFVGDYILFTVPCEVVEFPLIAEINNGIVERADAVSDVLIVKDINGVKNSTAELVMSDIVLYYDTEWDSNVQMSHAQYRFACQQANKWAEEYYDDDAPSVTD